MRKSFVAIFIAIAATSVSIPVHANPNYTAEQENEILGALKMLKIVRGEVSPYNPDEPKWLDGIKHSQTISCVPWMQFRVAVGLDQFMKEDKHPHVREEIQKTLSLEAGSKSWEETYKSVAKTAAENLVVIAEHPQKRVCKLNYQDPKAITDLELDLDDSVKIFEEVMQALVLGDLKPEDINSDTQKLRDVLLKAVKREVGKTKPRLAQKSADAEGFISSLLEQYDISPTEAGLSEEEIKVMSDHKFGTE